MGDVLNMIEYRKRLRERRRSEWAYGPNGLSGSGGPEEPWESNATLLAEVVDLGPARHLAAVSRTSDYLDSIIDKAYMGDRWAQFRLALIQLADEPTDESRSIMQELYGDMDPAQFETWLDRAVEEFDEYSDLLDNL